MKWFEKSIKILGLIFLFIFFILVLVSIFFFIRKFSNTDISSDLSDWASYAVCLSALFTFISVFLVYITYRNQVRTSFTSRFDTTFFNLLNIQRNIYEKITSTSPKRFVTISEAMNNAFFCEDYDLPKNRDESVKRIANDYDAAFLNMDNSKSFPKDFNDDIMHYFRHLYHIIKFIITNEGLDKKSKKKYIDLLQAQMSNEELVVMFFNVCAYYRSNKMEEEPEWGYINQLDKFGFFRNLRGIEGTIYHYAKSIFPKTEFRHLNQNAKPVPRPDKKAEQKKLLLRHK